MCTVTLVKGHDWVFDSKAVIKADHEAYFDDKKEWIGSNFLYGDIAVPVSSQIIHLTTPASRKTMLVILMPPYCLIMVLKFHKRSLRIIRKQLVPK